MAANIMTLKSPNLFQYEAEKKSYEFFYPSPHSSARQATAKSSVMNLVTTLIGGGVLLLPYTIARSGIVLGCFMMLLCAMGSSFTLYILVSCSRRSGAQSYEEIAKNAFGKRMQVFTMILLILLIFLAFVGYVILVRDIAGSLASQFIFGRTLSIHEENLVAMTLIGCVTPVLFLQKMNALRYTSVVGLCTVGIFAIGIFYRAIEKISGPTFNSTTIKYVADNVEDPMYALPIVISSFLCHFNVLPVYGELHKPTRHRLKRVVTTTVFSTSIFYMVLGTLGYIYAYEQAQGVQGDILNNFDRDDIIMNIGRCGILTTICSSLPLLILPCRRTLYRLLLVIKESYQRIEENEHKPLLATPIDDTTEKPIPLVPHIILTIVILAMAFYLAFSLPGVAVVWNIMGSTVGILISYVLPSACYIRIRSEKPNSDWRKVGAWVLLTISGSLFLYCSSLAFYKIGLMIFS
ncbi:sodium-coupled neutral amino acid transporter [Thraustotheca clavata]|uniref:Sodium-coupled neutral amino acid transporter n=1 Tax=Thraustotheca clavata TaxID=74557 RepID=A0A1W0A103_9STRA|nr:sodium-coupled neutral amino acid transporter [Thraustotheca clavata]